MVQKFNTYFLNGPLLPYLQIIHWHIITNYLVLLYTIFSLPVFLVEPLVLASIDR